MLILYNESNGFKSDVYRNTNELLSILTSTRTVNTSQNLLQDSFSIKDLVNLNLVSRNIVRNNSLKATTIFKNYTINKYIQ